MEDLQPPQEILQEQVHIVISILGSVQQGTTLLEYRALQINAMSRDDMTPHCVLYNAFRSERCTMWCTAECSPGMVCKQCEKV